MSPLSFILFFSIAWMLEEFFVQTKSKEKNSSDLYYEELFENPSESYWFILHLNILFNNDDYIHISKICFLWRPRSSYSNSRSCFAFVTSNGHSAFMQVSLFVPHYNYSQISILPLIGHFHCHLDFISITTVW